MVEGCWPAVVLIQPLACVGPVWSLWGRVAAMWLLHLIPRLHYTSAPVKQRTDVGTSPSLQRRRGILYCLMHRWGHIITSAESSKVKPECCFKCPNIGGWQSWMTICPNKFQSRHQMWVIIASQWISELRLTMFSLVHREFSITVTPANNTGQHSFWLFCPLIETNQAFLEGKFVTWACSSSRSDCLLHATLKCYVMHVCWLPFKASRAPQCVISQRLTTLWGAL